MTSYNQAWQFILAYATLKFVFDIGSKLMMDKIGTYVAL